MPATLFLVFGLILGSVAPAGAADLAVACTVPDAALADVRAPFDLSMERTGEALLIRFDPAGSSHAHLLLRLPGCGVVPLAGGPLPPGVHSPAVRPGGARLIAAARYPDGHPEWWYSSGPTTPLIFVQPPGEGRVAGQPILSEDGAWAAWVDQKPGTGVQLWHARELPATGEISGDLSVVGPGSYETIGFDPKSGTMTLARNLAEIVELDTRSGLLIGPPLRPGEGLSNHPGTYRRLENGWFAWDGYREDTPWRAVWSIRGRSGRYDVDWGKRIVHASVNPSGAYAALSLESRFGRIPLGSDALVLVRLADGKEIFRKRLPRFTRTRVAFLGEQHFAWTEGSAVVVARVP